MSLSYNPEVPYQVDNPTDKERHTLLKFLLKLANRTEDYDNIINLLNPPPDITTICPKGYGKGKKVAIIGAGEAGLSAAFELRKIGCDITIFEATDRIGGRIYTHYFDKSQKYFGELGAMRISPSHETTWHYINLFKLRTSPFVVGNTNALFYMRDARAVNDPEGLSVMRNIYPRYNLTEEERKTPWQKLNGRVFRRYLDSLSPEVRKELLETKPVYSPEIQKIDMLNHRMAYESVGLSQDAISLLGYLSTFEQTFFKLSLTEVLQEAYTIDFGFTYRINEGMITLPLSLYKALCNEIKDVYGSVSKTELGKVKFRMETPIDGIYESPDTNKVILEYRDTQNYTRGFENFDYVICAIPFTSLRRMRINPLFGVIKNQAINELNYEISHKTFLFLKDRFWEIGNKDTRILGGSTSSDLPLIATFYPSDHAMPVEGIYNSWTMRPGTSPYEPGVLLASYNWSLDAERLGNEYPQLLLYDIKRYIERMHNLPCGYIDQKLISFKSFIWSQSQYIWAGACLTKPKDKLLFSYVITLPEMRDKVFFAGEHISQKHGWQQGALQTGMIAANNIAQRIKAKKN